MAMASFVNDSGSPVFMDYVEISGIDGSPSGSWFAPADADSGNNDGIIFATVAIFASPDSSPRIFNYLDLSNILVTPDDTWYAGSASIDNGNNFNWIFSDGPIFGTGIGGSQIDAYPRVGYINHNMESSIQIGGY